MSQSNTIYGKIKKYFILKKINKKNINGFTHLMEASYNGDLESVKRLIEMGANLDLHRDIDNNTALMYASTSLTNDSYLEIVKELIKAGANLDLKNINGNTALMIASECSGKTLPMKLIKEKIIKELINSGANIDVKNNNGDTCLSFLVRRTNYLEIIKDIVSRGVSINHLTSNIDIRNGEYKYNGNSILHWCAIGITENTSSYEILEYLETLNIDKTLKNQEGKTYKDYLSNFILDLCSKSDLENIKKLVKFDINLNFQDKNGISGLMICACHKSIIKYQIIRELINAGANLDLQNLYDHTCLSYLIRYSNNLEIIKEVISRGVSINHLTKNIEVEKIEYKYNGNSLLHWCAIGIIDNTSSYEILEYLETLEIDKSLFNYERKRYKDYLPKQDIYYISNECHICYDKSKDMVILDCDCNCGKICLECIKMINKCYYCNKTFHRYKIIKFV